MLLDTDVTIDILRGYSPALSWLAGLGNVTVDLPGLVVMELIQGCRNQVELRALQRRIRHFTLHWPTTTDCERAMRDFVGLRLSHGLGLLDALIGQTAVGINEVLATFNIKHYTLIPGLITIRPY